MVLICATQPASSHSGCPLEHSSNKNQFFCEYNYFLQIYIYKTHTFYQEIINRKKHKPINPCYNALWQGFMEILSYKVFTRLQK